VIKPDHSEYWKDMKDGPVSICKDCRIYLHRSYLECPICKEHIDWSEYDSTTKEN